MTTILLLDRNGEKIDDYIFSIKLHESCIHKHKYLDNNHKLLSMPTLTHWLTKKEFDENNITEWDNYEYIIMPNQVNEANWSKNHKGLLYTIGVSKGGCTTHHAKCRNDGRCTGDHAHCVGAAGTCGCSHGGNSCGTPGHSDDGCSAGYECGCQSIEGFDKCSSPNPSKFPLQGCPYGCHCWKY